MRIADKTKEQLVEEVETVRLRIAELERTEAGRKRREEAIRKLEEEKLFILNSMSEHVVYQNAQHRILWANKAAAEAADLAREQLVGCYCYEIWLKRSEPCVDCPVAKARETGKPQASEMTTPDGKAWFVQGYPIRDTEDQIVGLVEVALEITERKQVEEALRKGERKYELLFESTLDGMLVLDAETMRVVLANQAAVDIYGLNSVEEAIGLNLLDCVPPEERERVLRIIVKDMFESDLRQVNEFRVITKDGRKIWVSAVGTRTEYRGKLAGLISFSDITERKQAEEALRIEKNKLQTVIDALEYGLTIQDRDYSILYQNELLKTISGNRLGEKCYQAYESRDQVCDSCPVEKAFKDGKSHTSERRIVTPSGEVTFLENTANPIRDAEGKIVSCLEINRNITERKQAEEALRESETKYRTTFENVSDVVVRLNKRGKILDANKRVEDYFGYKPDEIIGKNFTKLGVLNLKDLPKLVKLFSSRIKGKPTSLIELEVKRKDGSTAHLEANTTLVKEKGKIEGAIAIIRDITERKQAEEALRESREELRTMFESVTDGISVVNLHGIITEVNQRTVEIHGFSSKEELVGRNAFELVAPCDHERVAINMRKALKQGAIKGVEYTLLKADGSEFPGELSTSVLKDADGKAIGHITIARDITERKKAEEELHQAKERFQALVEESPVGVAMVTKDGQYQYVNPKFVKMFGYTLKDIPTKQDWFAKAYPDPEYREQVISVWDTDRRAAELGEGNQRIFTVTCQDGSEKVIQFRLATLGTGDYIQICEDITDRKRAEEELKLRAQILDSATDSIFVHDTDDNFIYANEAACRTHGYSREEFLKMKLPQIVAPERARPLDLDRQEVLGKGYIVTESVHLRKDGSIVPVEVHARLLESGGRKLFLNVVRDITERKRAEEEKREMEQKAHLASRLASVGEMASGIAHEINNPLTSVIGFSQLLMEGDIPADIKEDVSIIYKEAQRAAGVAKNLLTFARKQAPAKQSTNVNSIIDGVLKLRAYEQKVSNIQVDSQLAPDLPEVMADYSQLQQVFINIIINAESAMIEAHGGGTLTITTQRVNNTVRASFSDDGPGITKENLNRIFDPFFTTKEVGKGTGLGLSVCHGIVAEHGGKIYARSKVGKGATFIVELPANNS